MFELLKKIMTPIRAVKSLHLFKKQKFLFGIAGKSLAILFFVSAIACAAEFEDAFLSNRTDTKVLFLTSDVIKVLELTKLEAQKQNVQFDQITRYIVVFNKDTMQVSLAPPYKGGLDGPEFSVEIRRSDFKVLSVVNKLKAQ